MFVQRSAEVDALGCVNATAKLRQKWQARAGTELTKPGVPTLVEDEKSSGISALAQSASYTFFNLVLNLQNSRPKI